MSGHMEEKLASLKEQAEMLNKTLTIIFGIRFDKSINEDINSVQKIIDGCHDLISKTSREMEKYNHLEYSFQKAIENIALMKRRAEYMQINGPQETEAIREPANDSCNQEEDIPIDNGCTPINPGVRKNLLKAMPNVTPGTGGSYLAVPLTPVPDQSLSVSISYVSNIEFNMLPSYLKGRFRLEQLNEFVEMYNRVLDKKYSMLAKFQKTTRRSIHPNSELIFQWLEQDTPDLKGSYYCTEKDFNLVDFKLGKRENAFMTILRHLKRVKLTFKKKQSYFVAIF